MVDCLFCKIATGEMDAKVVHRDEHVVAFEDIRPHAPIHVLVIPREHVTGPDGIDPEGPTMGRMLGAAQRVARDRGLDRSGYRLVMNHGEQGGQTVFHVHLHLLGGRPMTWPPG